MQKMRLAGLALLALSTACPRPTVIPDARYPHQIAEEPKDGLMAWCKSSDGSWSKCRVRAQEGWWIASDQIVSGAK